MIQVSAEAINTRWDDLPYDLREFILSDELLDSIESACGTNSITDTGEIHKLTAFRLYGFLTTDGFHAGLSEIIGPEKSQSVFDSITAAIPEAIINLVPPPPENMTFVPLPPVVETIETNMIPETTTPIPNESPVIPPAITPEMPVFSEPLPATPPTEPKPEMPVVQSNPETVIPVPETAEAIPEAPIPLVAEPRIMPPPQQRAVAAPFMIHQETEVQTVSESAPEAKYSPLRPSFYEASVEEMREEKPSFARLQFGTTESPVLPQPSVVVEPPKSNPEKNATSAENVINEKAPLKPSLNDGNPIPEDNVVNLRDLPL